MERLSWVKASKHYEGYCLESGVDFTVSSKLRRGLRRAGLPQEAGLLEYIHQAGVWPATRLTRDGEAELVLALGASLLQKLSCIGTGAAHVIMTSKTLG